MKNHFQSKSVPRGTRTIWRYLSALLILFTFAIGNVWGTSYIPGDCKVVTANETIDYATIAGANATTSGKWIVNPRGGTTSSKKYTNLTSDTKGNPDGIVDNIATITSGVNMATIQVPSTAKYNQSGKYVIHMRITGITGIIAHGVTGSSGRGCAIYGQEYSTSLTENTEYGSALASMTRSGNSGSFLLQYTGFTASKEYLITIAATGGDDQLYAIELIAGAATKYTVTYKAGDGSGSDVVDSDAKTVKAFADCSFTAPSGYEFKEWQDGSSNVVAAGATVSADMTLTAIYRLIPTKYTVTYNLNGASGDAPTETSKAEGDAFNLAAAPSWAGHAFDGWLCSADEAVKAAGSSYTMTAANTTFTAQWHEVDCKIYSLTGGIGSAVVQQANATVNDGVSLILSNSDGIIKLSPASGSFNAGDIVTISGTVGNTTKEFGVKISNAADKKATLGTASVAGTTNPMVATATLSAASDYLYICRTGGTTQTILTCEVHRACAEGTEAGLGYAEAEVNKTEGDAAFTNPLTNANSLVLDGYKSSNEEVATVNFSTGEVTIVGAGSATITANSAVQTKAGTLYAAGTASYTLTVAALPKYHVTYDLNGGSGEVAEVDHKAGEKFTLHDGVTGVTAPGSKTFVNWKDQDDALFDGGVEYTMPAKDVTLTAQWAGDVYTVKFMDGETVLDTKVVEVGSHPTDIEHPTKPLSSFAAWQLSGSDVNLDEVSGTKDAIVTLTARWTKVYAQDADLEGLVESEGIDADWQAYMTGKSYAYSTSGVSLDAKAGGKDYNNWPYQGLKAKEIGAYVEGRIAADKLVIIKLGHMAAAANVSLDGVAAGTATGLDADEPAGQLNYFYVENESVLRYETTNGGACVLKAITITNPFQVTFNANGGDPVDSQYGHPAVTLPDASNGTKSLLGWFDAAEGGNKIGDVGESYTPAADIELFAQWEDVSTDARLASITFSSAAGTLSPAFDPEVVNYTYTMPYPTATVPTITGATAVNANAKAPVIDAQAANWGDVAHIHGVAQSDDTKDYYITMKIAPKDGVCLVWADVPADNTLTYNATNSKFYAESDVTLQNSNVKGKDGSAPSGKKFQSNGFLKIALNEGTFLEGDVVALNVTYGTANVMHVFKAQAATSTDVIGEAAGNTDAGLNKVAITEDASTLWLVRGGEFSDWNPHVDYVAVYRAMNPLLKAITIDGREGVIDALDDHHFNVLIPFEAELDALTIATTIVWNAPHATTPETVISNEGAWKEGDNTYRIMDKDGDYTDYTITLTRDVKKYTVTYYDGSTVLGTEDVEDGNHPTAAGITVPVKFGSTFAGWSEIDGGAVVELSDITISAAKDLFAKYEVIPCPTSGTVYKFEIKDGLASENLPIATDMDMSSYIDATGIGLLTYSATANNKATINSDGTIQLKDATAAYLKVELACALAAGDQIRAHVSNNPIRVQVGTTYDSSKDLILDKNAYDIVDITAAMEGLKVLYIARSTNGNANLADFEIYRRPALTGASLADLTMRQGQNKTPELTLEPSADAIVTSQVWEIVGEPTNLTGAAINGTTGVITTGTLNNPANNGTISVKVTLNGGSIEATCTVTVVDAIVQADVTKSTIWDWHNTGATANIQLTNSSDPKKNENFVLANVAVNNNADFESDKLAVEGEYMVRDYNAANPYFQGQLIQFHTTVAGVVRVKFSHTGSNKPARELFVNGVGTGDTRTQATGEWSRYVEVPAGDVSLTAFHVDPADGAGQQYIRIFEIEFLEIIDSRTEYAAKDLGTACYEYDAVVIGATPYMVDGVNGNGYIVFDEITSGVIDAGYPYLFEAAGGKVFFCKPVGTTAAPLVSGEETSVKGMIGTFSGTTLTQGEDDICYFAGRHIWRVNDFTVGIDVDPHRCYVNYDVLRAVPAAPAAAPGRRRVIMGVNGKDEAQGFENLNASETPMKVMIDGTLYILRGEKVFDATGRLVK